MKKFKFRKAITILSYRNIAWELKEIESLIEKKDKLYQKTALTKKEEIYLLGIDKKIENLYSRIGKRAYQKYRWEWDIQLKIHLAKEKMGKEKLNEKVHEKSKKEKDENLGWLLELSNKIIKN